MNLEVFHPKFSYLMEKYKIYLIKIYNKIKESFVNKIKIKQENFSVINDILEYISNFNKKYKTKINFINIIQGDEEDKKKIFKICDYLLDIFLDIYPEENEDKHENKNENIEEELDNDAIDDNEIGSDSNFEIIGIKEDEDDEYINFDEFYSKKYDKGKKLRREIIIMHLVQITI